MVKKIERNDENYGKINYELIGSINFLELIKNTSREEYENWSKKYHPTKYFINLIYEYKNCELAKKLNVESQNVDIYVCVLDTNKNWNCKFWKEKYPDVLKKPSYVLPIATSRKKVDKWKEALEILTLKFS